MVLFLFQENFIAFIATSGVSYELLYEKLQTYFYLIFFQQSPELTKNNKIDHQPKNKNGTNGHDNNILNNKKNSLGSKFQDVQRKWMSPQPPSIGDSDLESELRNLSSGPSSLPLGKDYYIDGRNTRFCQCQLGEDFKL